MQQLVPFRGIAFGLLAAAASIGCGGRSDTPASPSPPPPPPPPAVHVLSGRIVVAASPNNPLVTPGSAVRGATVEVTAGVAATRSIETQDDGAFRIDGATGTLTVRVSRTGFSSVTRSLTLASDTTLEIELRALHGGRLDIQVARDIIEWNQAAIGGASFRRTDLVTRWTLPVPVFVSDPMERDRVLDAMDYWQRTVGISYVLVSSSALPRLLIRHGTDGLAAQGGGRAVIDGTLQNNQAHSGLAVFEPGGGGYCNGASSVTCRCLYRHEIGHALGHLGHSNEGLMTTCQVDEVGSRSRAMMATLYALPHGTRVESDGTWWVQVE